MKETKIKTKWFRNHIEYYRNLFFGLLFPKKLADILYFKYMGGVKLTGIILPISMKK